MPNEMCTISSQDRDLLQLSVPITLQSCRKLREVLLRQLGLIGHLTIAVEQAFGIAAKTLGNCIFF
jgi:hypothetical protein